MTSFRRLHLFAAVLVTFFFAALLYHYQVGFPPKEVLFDWSPPRAECSTSRSHSHSHLPVVEVENNVSTTEEEVLAGQRTTRFRDALNPNRQYLTALSSGSFAEQFASNVNLMYLSHLSERIPVLPPFTITITQDTGKPTITSIPFSEIFNLTYIRQRAGFSPIEWSDIKELPLMNSTERPPLDPIGCWTSLPEVNEGLLSAAANTANRLGLDASYTQIPSHYFMGVPGSPRPMVYLNEFQSVIWAPGPDTPPSDSDAKSEVVPSPVLKHTRAPDQHLVCIDDLQLSTVVRTVGGWMDPSSLQWRQVGQYMTFTDSVMRKGKQYLGRIFEKDWFELSPFILILLHKQRFGEACEHKDSCVNWLGSIQTQVEDLQAEIIRIHNMKVSTVLVSGPLSPFFIEHIHTKGWFFQEPLQDFVPSNVTFNSWEADVIQAAAHSLAHGVIGMRRLTDTANALTFRRIEKWNSGHSSWVKMP